ncbi:MAG: fibronectin type III domain-containing protein [Acidimicrobiales bacterium]
MPNAPGTPSATRADQSALVSWSAPDDQGCAVTAYNVRVNGGAMQSVGAGVTSHTFTGLTNGTSYRFEVRAVNEEGPGAWSTLSAAVVPAGRPTAPTISSVGPTAVGVISVGWGGASGNGDAISFYQYRVNGGTATTTTSNPQAISGLNNSSSYSVEVRACNTVGCGVWSASQSTTTWGPPSAPASVSASSGNATATLFWAAPASTGGQPVTSWQVVTGPGSLTPSSSSGFSNTYTSLTNGITYTFAVRACNAVGCGPYGTTSATPTAPPPFVTVGVGSQYTGAGCNSGDCQRIQVTGGNYTPNTTITVVCHASNGAAFTSYSTAVDGTGAINASGCFFGYPGETVWVVAGGVTSPSIVWP